MIHEICYVYMMYTYIVHIICTQADSYKVTSALIPEIWRHMKKLEHFLLILVSRSTL